MLAANAFTRSFLEWFREAEELASQARSKLAKRQEFPSLWETYEVRVAMLQHLQETLLHPGSFICRVTLFHHVVPVFICLLCSRSKGSRGGPDRDGDRAGGLYAFWRNYPWQGSGQGYWDRALRP